MRYSLYIIKSNKSGKYYVGQTRNLRTRFERHLNGKTSFGKRNKDLEIVYTKEFTSHIDARKTERFIKRQKSHIFIDRLIKGEYTIPP